MNVIEKFAKNLVDQIADAGEKFLDLRRLRSKSVYSTVKLCEELISHKGVASGIALAREIINRYRQMTGDDKLKFFVELKKKTGPDIAAVSKLARIFLKTRDEERLMELSKQIRAARYKLFNRLNTAPGGTAAIVHMREDLLQFLPEHPELKVMDEGLKELLTSWFNPGFLVLKNVDWNTEAAVLEKIIRYETVHDIKNWDDLKRRLGNGRKCFAFFHPALEGEPLIFVEIALTKGIAGSIQSIINSENHFEKDADTAIFYSINNCLRGLKRIPLGDFLIKQVVNELAMELPSIKTYCTLSPVPGFARWVREEVRRGKSELIPQEDLEKLKMLENKKWYRDPETRAVSEEALTRACAVYLVRVKRNGKPIDPVARFHFGNGAQLYRINWMGDTSAHGLKASFGLMVNYLYDLKHIESNHEAYEEKGVPAVSRSVRSLLG